MIGRDNIAMHDSKLLYGNNVNNQRFFIHILFSMIGDALNDPKFLIILKSSNSRRKISILILYDQIMPHHK